MGEGLEMVLMGEGLEAELMGEKLMMGASIATGSSVNSPSASKVFFSIVYGSVSFGYSLSELQTFGAAIASAKYVFGTIDRVSLIVPFLCCHDKGRHFCKTGVGHRSNL